MSTSPPLSDDAFLSAFLDCSLKAEQFDHDGHLRAAWLLVQRRPLDDAVAATCQGIARLAQHFGAPDKFHHTLTEAFVRLIGARSGTNPATDWAVFLERNPDFRVNAHALVSRYYSADRLALREARQRFIEPDRMPLPLCLQAELKS